MNDSFAERLGRFTPDRAGLDRDALLFAAGRASARPNRGWKALAGALAACQLLSVALLWPKPSPPAVAPSSMSERSDIAATIAPRAAEPASPNQLWVMRARMISGGGDFRPPTTNEPLVPDEPPLRVFPLPRSKFLN